MAQVLLHRPGGNIFKAFVKVQANAGVKVTLTGTKAAAQTLTADSNGIATFTVKKKDNYTVTTDADTNGTSEALENSGQTSCAALKNKETYNLTCVRVGNVTALKAGVQSPLINYIIPTFTAAYRNGWILRYNATATAPARPTEGTGLTGNDQNITVDGASVGTGKLHSGLTVATTYTYSAFGTLTLNGKTFTASAKSTASCVAFKSTVNVQANASVSVTLAKGNYKQTVTANANGIAGFSVREQGTYTITTNATTNSTSLSADSAANVNVNANNKVFTPVRVYVGNVSSINAGVYAPLQNYIIPAFVNTYRSGWVLRFATGTTPPANPSAGTAVSVADTSIQASSTLSGTGKIHTGLTKGTTYSYAAFGTLSLNGKTFTGTHAATAKVVLSAAAGTVQTKVFNSSQNWTVPAGVRSITVFCVGGGGGGSGHGGGGAGGYTKQANNWTTSAGQVLAVTVGAGGSGAGISMNGNAGGSSTAKLGNNSLTANGGGGSYGIGPDNIVDETSGVTPKKITYRSGGNGGSGGGASDTETGASCSDGASNGANAEDTLHYVYNTQTGGYKTIYTFLGGKGQGTPTSFNNVMYAGGGGGAPGTTSGIKKGGAGGGNNGGKAKSQSSENGGNGVANTGGGGGAAGAAVGGAGGSGVVVIQYTAAL